MTVEQLDHGRQAYARRQWGAAYASIAAARSEAPLPPEDLLLMATSAALLGRDDESDELFAAAYRGFLYAGEPDSAARCTFWAATWLLRRGQRARAAGWLARAHRLLDAGVGEAEQAYLQLLEAARAVEDGRPEHAVRTATEVLGTAKILATARRTEERELEVLARLTLATCDVLRGRSASGLALLDEVVGEVSTGALPPLTTGIALCTAVDLSAATVDLPRAREWTTALTRWCDAQPDLVVFRGECLVARTRLMRLRGSWPEAVAEAGRAVTRLSDPAGQAGAGDAWYELGEVLRLRGELAGADAAYRSAGEHGREIQPGHALLSLARGRTAEAADAVRQALAQMDRPSDRARTLPVATEILLAAGDVDDARETAAELGRSVQPGSGTMLGALADQAAGAVLLAEGRPRPALETLHRSWAAWVRLDVPYEVARTRVLLARAGSAVGDDDGARLELESACHAFERLGAAPDLAVARSELRRFAPAADVSGLTQREMEVLRLVAAGRTNRAIAAELFLSEKTVSRHLSNIFAKLDVPSRAAATVYAYEHGLV